MNSLKRTQQLAGILNENFDQDDQLLKNNKFTKEDDSVIMAQGIMEDDNEVGNIGDAETKPESVVDNNISSQSKPTSTYNEALRNEVRKIVDGILNESEEDEKKEKYFLVTDKTGRSMKPYKLDRTHIEKNWDLSEEDWDSEETLGDFLENCYIGDKWNTRTEKLECIKIK